ncbi:MAG: ABC transporter substrate-binding protein [Cyanobacteria bacterium]|nr:ABC transporter substrate-binding protein [Cyanobacteria bacterium CG_2015-16_32_12]NCO78663.1 ABC transporter substrate-binding protein [Cyanobacteria bacterium CG_2015-22_32_23]NCQ05706.1 ABC transporter substrate-binding protein [Cyanobacteria bacterium CG_2015-09_32_10]NCQ42983.1 ABC transporter substrate-binding protein [Cyanobacteria bacterium CG_2015-04_32_10]NCS84434.1 ABC transporter substrate-binding protein [Cyanobacteria bacterium CG_2015-02_32_10]
MKNYQLKRVLALFISLNWLTVGCGMFGTTGENTTTIPETENTDTAENSSEGLKLGALFPITGDLSSIGQNMPIASQLAVDTVNACGGVNGKPVTLVKEDDQTDPVAGTSAITKLAEVDKVSGVVGSFASSVSTAALDVAVRNNVMMISPGSTSPVFTDRAKKGEFNGFWARTAPPDTYQAQALAALAQKEGFKNVSTVVINNDYGVAFESQFVNAFTTAGGNILNQEKPVRYDPKATTLDSEAGLAFGNNPDAVAAVLYAETGSLLLQAAYKQGLTKGVTVLLTDGVYSEDFTKQVGKTADGTSIIAGALGTVPGADGKALQDFTTLWKEKTGDKPVTAFVPHTWDATILLMLAAQSAGSNTGEGIKSKIREVSGGEGTEVTDPCQAMELLRKGEKINYQGASGNVDVDENGDVVGVYDVWKVNPDGSLAVIDKISPIIK